MKYTVDNETYEMAEADITAIRKMSGGQLNPTQVMKLYAANGGDMDATKGAAKAMAGTAANGDKPKRKQNRKPNPLKRSLINHFLEALGLYDDAENVVVVNEEREITFSVGDKNFKLTLSQTRDKK